MVSELAPAVDADWFPGVGRSTLPEVERDYRRYPGISDGNKGPSDDVPADVYDDLEDKFVQQALWKIPGCTSFTASGRSAIFTPVKLLSMTVLTLVSEFD